MTTDTLTARIEEYTRIIDALSAQGQRARHAGRFGDAAYLYDQADNAIERRSELRAVLAELAD